MKINYLFIWFVLVEQQNFEKTNLYYGITITISWTH